MGELASDPEQRSVSAEAIVEGVAQIDLPAIALVRGEPLLQLPLDLYIPPDALEICLDAFEGPLDLLLYLIKRRNLDILDIPIAEVTAQYIEYVERMTERRLELAPEYLVMAALLAEIKSRMLLPRPVEAQDGDEDDPRAELVRRLLEYERFRTAAQELDALPRIERELFAVHAELPAGSIPRPEPKVELNDLLDALREVLTRAELSASHRIVRESLSLRERMSMVLERLSHGRFHAFSKLFELHEGRPGAVVTLLAVLELIKSATLELVQSAPYAPIHVRMRDCESRSNDCADES